MAHDPGPCSAQFEDYKDAYQEWENKYDAAYNAAEDAYVNTGIALAGCATGNILACGMAAANALYKDYQSVRASLSCTEEQHHVSEIYEDYENCTEEHKDYYNPLVPINFVDPDVTDPSDPLDPIDLTDDP